MPRGELMDFKHNQPRPNVPNPNLAEGAEKAFAASNIAEMNKRLEAIEASLASQARTFSELQIVLSTILQVVGNKTVYK